MSDVSNKIKKEVEELGTAPMPVPTDVVGTINDPNLASVKKPRKPRAAKKTPAVNVKQLQAENEQLKKMLDVKSENLQQAEAAIDRLVAAYTKVTKQVEQNMENFVQNTKLVLEKGAL